MRQYRADDPELQRGTADLGPLFQPQVRLLARRTDPDTSKEAALRLVDGLNALQQRVLQAFQAHGPMSAKQAEQLPEFGDLGFSTVRKRISELASHDKLRSTGRIESGCTVYEVSEANR